MGTGERNNVATVVFRLCGQQETGPKPERDQSRARMSAPVSPPPKGKLSLVSSLVMLFAFTREWDLPNTPAQCSSAGRLRGDDDRNSIFGSIQSATVCVGLC